MSERISQKVSISSAVKPSVNELRLNLSSHYAVSFRRRENKNGPEILAHDVVISEAEAADLLQHGYDLEPGLSAYRKEEPPPPKPAKKAAKKAIAAPSESEEDQDDKEKEEG